MKIGSLLPRRWKRSAEQRRAQAATYRRAVAAEQQAGTAAARAWERPGGPVDPGVV